MRTLTFKEIQYIHGGALEETCVASSAEVMKFAQVGAVMGGVLGGAFGFLLASHSTLLWQAAAITMGVYVGAHIGWGGGAKVGENEVKKGQISLDTAISVLS